MPVKWDDKAMLDLFMVVLSVTRPSQFSPEQKAEIVQEMKIRGYDIVWNGIRLHRQDWDAPGLYKDLLASMAIACKPTADTLKEVSYHLYVNLTSTPLIFITMATNRQAWDGDAHRDLLIAMVDVLSPSGEQIRNIVERTTTMGYTYTPKAVVQHLQKLRRSATEGGASTASPKTPKQKAPRTPKKSTGKTSIKADPKRKVEFEDESTVDTPSKKPRFSQEIEDSDDFEVKKEIVAEDNLIDFGEP
ncbi:hypothetical protein CMQ_4767 [Grosmannia clavigera kw1407]|uniref:Uncharacterized protein n=1 Tax=Grosmannia clavigera (strain kw1407 / UAMH 11150) TaxID=655863 RepID=F0XTG5_GROCL|nr:uncharacterized protein CMQ_4767 [Grosmannia clavigera kw1407]EFW98915.1 hypothetical protein CMQ_4767 [Grosmannia clavigera kw1407]